MNLSFDLADGRPIHASLREGAFTIAVDRQVVHTFDNHGRWLTGAADGRWWRRGMDGRSVGGPKGDPVARALTPDQAVQAHEAARHQMMQVRLQAQQLQKDQPELGPLVAVLDRAVRWDQAAAAEDARAFAALYAGPIPVVPGDLPRAIYLQATRGCAWNRCSYCTLYAGMQHTVEADDAFDAHVRAVLAWYAEALPLRRTVFVGDADVLAGGAETALRWLQVLDRHVERAPRGLSPREARAWQPLHKPGIWAVDGFAAPQSILQCTSAQLTALAEAGLERLYLGLETGDPSLRKHLRRPESVATVARAVQAAKAAGLQIALMVIAGLGGRQAGVQHVARTADFLRSLPLDPEDLISISPLLDPTGTAGTVDRLDTQALMTELEIAEQVEALKSAVGQGGPRIAPYDLAGFVP